MTDMSETGKMTSMHGIEWNERFSVDVPAMDAQHKRLIDLINALRVSDDIGLSFDAIMGMFDYASVHFRAEESLLRESGYSELHTQEREHKGFLEKAVSFSKMDLAAPQTATEIVLFLRSWLLNHILKEDMKYKRCIPEQLARQWPDNEVNGQSKLAFGRVS